MSRKCEITGKGPQYGNNVSHANNKTRRRFLPNLQDVSFYSSTLKKSIKVTASTHGIRLIALTGYGLAEDQRRVLEAGFDLHLVKPVELNALLEQLADPALRPRGAGEPIAAQT